MAKYFNCVLNNFVVYLPVIETFRRGWAGIVRQYIHAKMI